MPLLIDQGSSTVFQGAHELPGGFWGESDICCVLATSRLGPVDGSRDPREVGFTQDALSM